MKRATLHPARRVNRPLGGAAVLTLAIGGLMAFAGPARATSVDTTGPLLGALHISPVTGYDTELMQFETSELCPAPATNVVVQVSGAGIAQDASGMVGNSAASIYQPDGSDPYYVVPTAATLSQVANEQTPPADLTGTYQITLKCIKAIDREVYGRFVGSFTISDRKYHALGASAKAVTPPTAVVPPTGPSSDAPSTAHVGGSGAVSASPPGRSLPRGSAAAGPSSAASTPGAGPAVTSGAGVGVAEGLPAAHRSGGGPPAWVVVLLVLAGLWLIAGSVAALRRRRTATGPPG